MKKTDFIKVAGKDEGKSHIIPASNRSFYKSQGYTVEDLTDEEFAAYQESIGAVKKEEPITFIPIEETEEFKAIQSQLGEANAALETEKGKTASLTSQLGEANAALEKVNKELEALKKASK